MMRSDWDLHLCHCQALQVMDMKVHTGEISPYLKPSPLQPPLPPHPFFFLQYINNNITHTEPEIKSTQLTRPHPERIIQPCWGSFASGHDTPETARQPLAGFLPWSTAGQAALMPPTPSNSPTFHCHWHQLIAYPPQRGITLRQRNRKN